jgi:tetratricopeptide (TPR) repeat protein
MYEAAVESYTSGLRPESLVPTLLSNRAQTFINMERWPDALADSAASLTIRPSCKKTLLRYQKALKQVLAQHEQSKSTSLRVILEPTLWHSLDNVKPSTKTSEQLKVEGNEAFKCLDYSRASDLYTSALLASDVNVRAVLGNWSQASLELKCYHECLAAAAASLRIWTDDKAVYRLCKALAQLNEVDLATSILLCYNGSAPGLGELRSELKSSISYYNEVHSSDDNGKVILVSPPKICPDWVSNHIETFSDTSKGRGIRARDSLPSHCLLMIETPLALASSNTEKDKSTSYTLDQNRRMNDTTRTLLGESILNQIQRDQLLSERISNLYDGTAPRPLVDIQDLLNSIGVANAPLLLPPRPEFFLSKSQTLTAERVRNILDINSFGSVDPTKPSHPSSSKKETLVYSAVSMFNHSFDPNCLILGHGGSSRAVVTTRAVENGEELTISYHSDPDVLKQKWGIAKS